MKKTITIILCLLLTGCAGKATIPIDESGLPEYKKWGPWMKEMNEDCYYTREGIECVYHLQRS